MLKRIIKAVTVAVTIICLVVCMLPTYAFADVVEFTEAAKLGATIVDLYGAANNTSLAYDYLSDGSALTVIENLYTEYSSSAGDPYTLAAIGAAAAAAGTIAVVYDAITGKGYIQLYQTQYITSLDGFWDYTLGDLGLNRNNEGLYEYDIDSITGDVEPVSIPGVPGSFPNQPLTKYTGSSSDYESLYNSGLVALTGRNAYYSSNLSISYTGDTTTWYSFIIPYNNGYRIYCLRPVNISSNVASATFIRGNQYAAGGTWAGNNWTVDGTTLWFNSLTLDPFTASSFGVPQYTTFNEGFTAIANVLGGRAPAAFLEPQFYVGDPLTAVPTITVPDVAGDPDYAPQPMRINTDIEWLPEWGDPYGVPNPEPGVPYPVTDPSILNDAVPEIWKSVVQGTKVSPDNNPDPDPDPDPDPENPTLDEVFNPLLPVTLPSFNFSFSGIWHYVREWVSSLGSWFTTLFLIWSKLPYAMVVPVYATAVVVIVLGVYKRFFM